MWSPVRAPGGGTVRFSSRAGGPIGPAMRHNIHYRTWKQALPMAWSVVGWPGLARCCRWCIDQVRWRGADAPGLLIDRRAGRDDHAPRIHAPFPSGMRAVRRQSFSIQERRRERLNGLGSATERRACEARQDRRGVFRPPQSHCVHRFRRLSSCLAYRHSGRGFDRSNFRGLGGPESRHPHHTLRARPNRRA